MMAAMLSEPPVRRCMSVDDPEPDRPSTLDTPEYTGVNRSRILVVEDNYFVGLTIENALTDAGYEVTAVVDSGEAALENVVDGRPDLVLMDIRLAGDLDGIETAIALHRKGIVSLFASAHFDTAIKERGAAARPAGWLVKPFSDSELIGAVGLALGDRKSDV